MSEIDLTDYVDVGARAWFESIQSDVKWDDVPEGVFKYDARNSVLPTVQAVIKAYDKAHPNQMVNFMEAIG